VLVGFGAVVDEVDGVGVVWLELVVLAAGVVAVLVLCAGGDELWPGAVELADPADPGADGVPEPGIGPEVADGPEVPPGARPLPAEFGTDPIGAWAPAG
jgi:hypothetical protein